MDIKSTATNKNISEIMRLDPPNPLRDQMFNYSMQWFLYHAEQRYKSFQMYVIQLFLAPLGAIAAAHVSSSKLPSDPSRSQEFYAITLVIGILGLLSTIIFYKLDRRNMDLVKLGEAALRHCESQHFHGACQILLMKTGATTKKQDGWGLESHAGLIRAFFYIGGLVFSVISLVSVVMLVPRAALDWVGVF